jgi:hypothetical protein
MKFFPTILNVKNKEKFKDIYFHSTKGLLRKTLYKHIISKNESEYFSLDEFNQKISDMELVKKSINAIIPELEELGWKCKLSFGGTGLFIYSDKVPPNCWDDTIN